jgi:tetratricopeptide (TPR) repeat protein
MESLIAMSDILRVQRRWEEMTEMWDRAVAGDPTSRGVLKARERVTRLREADREIEILRRELAANPQNPEAVSNLLRLYIETGQPDLAKAQLEQSQRDFNDNPEFLKFAVEFSNSNGQWQAGLGPARKLAALMTNDAGIWLALARFEFANRDANAFLEAARKAIQLGGVQVKSAMANDPMYASIRGTPEFGQLMQQ